jgi:hypothetical protein
LWRHPTWPPCFCYFFPLGMIITEPPAIELDLFRINVKNASNRAVAVPWLCHSHN